MLLNVTAIAKEFDVKPQDINKILTDLGFQRKGSESKGYILEDISRDIGTQRIISENKTPYIQWDSSIIKNPVLINAIEAFKNPGTIVYPAPDKATDKFKFDRTTFKAEFRCADGHYVRSKSEVIVDNWLYMNNIVHAYEKRLPIIEEVYSDFYIKQHNIYVEFWGYENDPKYLARKEKKKALYKKYGLKLIELDDTDLKDIDDILPIKLLELGVQLH